MRIPTVHPAVLVTIMAGLGGATPVLANPVLATPVPSNPATPERPGMDIAAVVELQNGFRDDDASFLVEDPAEFFERLVDRYRDLRRCREDVRVEQVTVDPESDDPPLRSVVRVVAEVRDEGLTVRSSDLLDEALELLGPADDVEVNGASESDLRLLPHLRLRFSPDPLEDLSAGGSEDLRPVELEPVTLDDRDLLRVELRSGESSISETTLSLFVDPRSMLVERIEGEQWLPGGLHHRTMIRVEDRDLEIPGGSLRMDTPDRPSAPIDDGSTRESEKRSND